MGRKIKKKARHAHKEKRPPNRSGSENSNPGADVDASTAASGETSCSHIDQTADYGKLAAKLGGVAKCGECRDHGAADKRAGKEKGKQGRQKGIVSDNVNAMPKCIWVCMECGHLACSGQGGEKPKGHALHHFRQTRHPFVFQFYNPVLCWCFSCNLFPQVKSDTGKGESDNILLRLQELVKGNSIKVSSGDVEDVWFSSNSGDQNKMENRLPISDRKGYAVKGLTNIGNTCFFNSIMQNIFAVGSLRKYFLNLDRTVGPLTMALKKLFNETSLDVDSKYCLNPKNFFGCISSKAPQFKGHQQQDSHELLRCLLDGLCTEELNSRKFLAFNEEEGGSKMVPTIVDLIFGGQLSSTVCCVECGHSSIVYEPFLDLSLPIPVKRQPAKKFQASLPKRTRLRQKEGYKGGKVRDRRKNPVVTPVQAQSIVEDVNVLSVPTEASMPNSTSAAEQVSLLADNDCSWVDYLPSPKHSSNGDSETQKFTSLVDQDVEEDKSSWNMDMAVSPENCSSGNERPGVKTESIFKPTESDNPLSVQESEVSLLPYKEEDFNRDVTEIPGNLLVTMTGQEGNEVDFIGLGDLFNEPEVISGPKLAQGSKEEMETALLGGNSSESDEDEVDKEISLDSCLALFIQPELLSNEQGWHCGNCSKILKQQIIQERDGMEHGDGRDTLPRKLKSQPNVGRFMRKESLSTLNKDTQSNVHTKCLSDKQICKSVEDDLSVTQSQFDKVEESSSVTSDLDQEKYSNVFDNSDSVYRKPAQLHEASQSEAENYHDSQICAPSKSSVRDDATILLPSNSIEGDVTSEVGQARSQDSRLLGQADQSNDYESEEVESCKVKVKRDATKQILISKAPEVLTVHLKRFYQDARGRLSKLNGHISFSEILNLQPYMDHRIIEKEQCRYRLIGIVEHQGTMRSGHYVAYVRGEKLKGENEAGISTWFYASDATVMESSLADVLNSEAYILFYEKI